MVRFRNGRIVRIEPEDFSTEVIGRGKCRRLQLPLKLAYAVTVHKAQGMSLDDASMKLDGSFCAGQVYVGLSRAKSIGGLHLQEKLKKGDVHTDKDVQAFDAAFFKGERPVGTGFGHWNAIPPETML